MTESQNAPDAVLNEHQHRALSTRLAILDREIYEAECLVKGQLARGDMFETNSDLTSGETQRLLDLFGDARSYIRTLRERFGLAVQRSDVRHWLQGHFSISWSILQDSRASKLIGFGPVHPDLPAQLDPEIDQLVEIVNMISSTISSA